MKFFLFLLGLLFSLPIFSQKDSIKVFGHIADAFTGAIIEDGTIDVLSPDSTVLFSGEWVYNTDDDVRTASLYYCKIPEEGNYILRLQHPNYFPLYFPITVKLGRAQQWCCEHSSKSTHAQASQGAKAGRDRSEGHEDKNGDERRHPRLQRRCLPTFAWLDARCADRATTGGATQ